jgi:small subunit ribosomal protein S6
MDSLLKSEEIDAFISKYERFIAANGGQIESVERWGKKRLAYEIKKRQYGFYVLIRFDGPPTIIKSLEREYRLNESLLRFKTQVMNKLAIEALAAKGAAMPQRPADAPEAVVVPVVIADTENTAPAVIADTASADPAVVADTENTAAVEPAADAQADPIDVGEPDEAVAAEN